MSDKQLCTSNSTGNSNDMGTFYGIGVGPGDPDLVTLKAVKAIKNCQVIFTARSPKNQYSIALDTVKEHIEPGTPVVSLDFPMTKDEAVLHAAWERNARTVLAELGKGHDAVFLTIGDSLTYSTFGYLMTTLRRIEPGAKVQCIPGITAYHAAASRLGLPLVEGKESLLIVSGIKDMNDLAQMAECAENMAILKAYRNYDQIVEAIDMLPENYTSYTVSSCGLPGERVHEDAHHPKGEKMPYLSLIIAKKEKN
jgi:precorrin-2/cobalt-factor-2 C20-methyltransferase